MALYKCIYFTYSHRHGRKHCVRTVVCSLVFANTIKLWVFLPTQVTTPGSKRSPKYRAASFGGHLPLRNVTGPASQNNKPHLAGNAGLNLWWLRDHSDRLRCPFCLWGLVLVDIGMSIHRRLLYIVDRRKVADSVRRKCHTCNKKGVEIVPVGGMSGSRAQIWRISFQLRFRSCKGSIITKSYHPVCIPINQDIHPVFNGSPAVTAVTR